MIKEFRDFLMKGNLVEIAVGLILALAFNEVVNSLVDDVIMQIIAAIGGQPNFNKLEIDLGGTPLRYGKFLTAVVSFLIIGFVLFMIVKAYNKAVAITRRQGRTEETADESAEVVLLRQIRDELAAGRPSR